MKNIFNKVKHLTTNKLLNKKWWVMDLLQNTKITCGALSIILTITIAAVSYFWGGLIEEKINNLEL